MLKDYKKFLVALGLLLASEARASDDLVVKLTGGFDFQAGYFNSNAHSKAKYLTPNKKHWAFNTSAHIGVDASNTLDNGFMYGAKIAIEPTTNSSRKFQSGIYTESNVGRLELGSDKSATNKMRITPFSIAAATGGLWDMWVKGDPNALPNDQIPYVVNFGNFLDSKMRTVGKNEFSRKITYYTPEYKGLQFGISYIPDSSNVGYNNSLKADEVKHTPIFSKYNYAVRDGWAGGLTYKKSFDENLSTKLALVGEIGKVKATPKKDTDAPAIKVKNLKNYTIGGEVTYGEYTLAASYGNYMRTMTAVGDQRSHTSLYGIGGRYKYEKLTTSLTYFTSTHRKNNVKAATLAVDYKFAQGFLPYAEVTYFKANGRGLEGADIKKKAKHQGVLFLCGAKVEF